MFAHVSGYEWYPFGEYSIKMCVLASMDAYTYTETLSILINDSLMNNEQIISALNWRYAVQGFDKTKKVSADNLHTILEAGRLAPSSFGLEGWKFIVVENPELRAKVSAAGYGQPKITEASHLIVIARRTDARATIVSERIARTAKVTGAPETALAGFKDMLDGTVAMRDDSALDTWMKTQTYIPLGIMMETASLLQVDNAAMEGFDPKGVDDALGLTAKHLTATTLLALGYRSFDDAAATRPKVRRDFDDVVEFLK